MKQLYLKLSVLLLFITHFTIVNGQGSMYVHNTDGKHQSFFVSDIDKLTFSGENMLVNFKSNQLRNYVIPEIRYCNFKGSEDMNDPHYVIRIFPNPTKNKFYIESSIEINEIILYDIIGQKLMQVIPESGIIQFQLNNYSCGVYVLHIKTPVGDVSEKIIKD